MGRFLDAAETVLKRERRPMHARELTESAISLGLLEFSDGRTPHQTMKAKLSVDIRTHAARSRFKRSGRGRFALREFNEDEYFASPIQKVLKPSEDVLVFPAKLLDQLGRFHGIRRDPRPYAETLLAPNNSMFMRRIEAETDLNYKQVISYVIVRNGDSVLRFVRGSYTSVQTYLKGRYCIGFGGHVQSRDRTPLFPGPDSGYQNSIYRELSEELNLPRDIVTDDRLQMIGALNDDSSDLGKVHFAFIHLLDLTGVGCLPSARELKKEKSINQLNFIPIRDLGSEFERYEYWSKLCIKTFFGKAVKILCRVREIGKFRLRSHCRNIAVVGRIGSGKTEACKLLQKKFGYQLVSSGHVMEHLLGVSLGAIGRGPFQERALSYITAPGGAEKLASGIYERVANSGKTLHAVDGLRSIETFELLKKKLGGDLALIYVDSTVDSAYKFFEKREGRGVSFDEFLSLIQHPVERGTDQFLARANVVFYNHGDRVAYLERVGGYLKSELQ
jgi:predicted NUDIX family phosphoesterase